MDINIYKNICKNIFYNTNMYSEIFENKIHACNSIVEEDFLIKYHKILFITVKVRNNKSCKIIDNLLIQNSLRVVSVYTWKKLGEHEVVPEKFLLFTETTLEASYTLENEEAAEEPW